MLRKHQKSLTSYIGILEPYIISYIKEVEYYQIPNNSDERNNSDGWKDAWILIIAMTGIIALGVKSFNFNDSDGLNNSNGWKKTFNG